MKYVSYTDGKIPSIKLLNLVVSGEWYIRRGSVCVCDVIGFVIMIDYK
jgi:hypothetical protein